MGKLVVIGKRARVERKGSLSSAAGEILLFTGVRYERGQSVADKASQANKRKRKRG